MEFDVEQAISVLECTPRTLQAMLGSLAPVWTDATEGPETWSPYVIVGHLIHGERTDWIPRARIILAQGTNRHFTPFDRFAQLRDSRGSRLLNSSTSLPDCARTAWPRPPRLAADLRRSPRSRASTRSSQMVTLRQLLAMGWRARFRARGAGRSVMAKQHGGGWSVAGVSADPDR